MEHLGTKTLDTNRLVLRKINTEDACQAYENFYSEPEVNRFISWNSHKNVDETKELFNNWIQEYNKEDIYRWIIEVKDTQEVIGTIEVVNILNKHEICEIGINIGKPWWGKGYASESIKRVCEYLLNEVKIRLIEGKCREENIGSSKAMQKAGFIYEGTLRKRRIDKNDGHIDNLMIYSITKEEL